MKVLILTSGRQGLASRALPRLAEAPGIEVCGVILVAKGADNRRGARRKKIRRQLRKVRRIGVAGAINGVRMRGWYEDPTPDIEPLCHEHDVPFYTSPRINGPETRKLFRQLEPDLGLSLGNGYIGPKVFSIPRLGMVNVHTELLPEFPGAQSIIWPIHEGSERTGFTIHRVNHRIDGGDVLYRAERRIEFEKTLAATVRRNLEAVRREVPDALAALCSDFDTFAARGSRQSARANYTTPTIGQFCRMQINNRRAYRRRAHTATG